MNLQLATMPPPQARSLLAAIVESSTDAISSRDLNGAVTEWNRAAVRLFGYEREDILGRPAAALIPSGRMEEERAVLERVLSGERVENYEAERLHKDGGTVEVSVTVSPVHDAAHEIVGVASIERDISARRAAERERDALIAELERSNGDLEQFAYVASHDLSEPLRAVAGMIDLLARRYEDELDETAHDYIARAVGATQRMQALINDLLLYSRAGRTELCLEECDTAALMQQAAESLGPAIEEAGAELSFSDLPTVSADPSKLGHVFQNLLANAIKFAGAEAPRIFATAVRDEDGWRLRIADNGIGIAPRHRERIFKIFNRLHGREAYPGTGIGLALCKRHVEAHGGKIWVADPVCAGSVVEFTIADREAGS